MSSALSVGAEAVSNAFQWISTEIRKTLEEDEDFSILFSKPPRLTGDESYDAYGERGRNSRSSYYGDGGDHGVYVHRREGVHTPPKTSISLDCLTSWQDSLEEEEGGGCYSSSSSFSPLPSSSSPTLRKPLASKTSSSSHLRLSRKCSTSTTASSIHTNRNSPPFLHCNYTKEEEKLRSSSSSSSFSTGCISPPDGLTPPTSTLLFMKEEEEDLLLSSPRKTSPSSPFPVDVDLNHKLYVFRGDPCCLKVDALVCFTNENFSSADDLGRRLRAIGEEALLDEIRNLERCKAGEARICRSFNLPSSRIIYTVGPKFNNKYITATHNALNACIRESLLLLDEHGLTTVALPFFIPKSPSSKLSSSNRRIYGNARVPPSSSSSNYMRPSQCMRDLQGKRAQEDYLSFYGDEQQASRSNTEDASSSATAMKKERDGEGKTSFIANLGGDEVEAYIHTLLRSLRRWMEKLREKLVAVVLVVPDDSQEDGEGEKAYEHFIKLYFPRSPFEEAEALIHLPQETGDIYGQIEVSERRIRIDKDGYKRNQKSPSSSSKMYTGSESSSTGRSAPHQFGRLLMRPDDDDDDEDGDGNFALNRKGQEEEDEDEFDHVILRCTDVSFTDAQSSTETERRLKALTSSPGIQDPVYGWEEDSETVYHRYLRQASAIGDCVAFRQLDKLNFLYPCSTDKAGRRVIVFLAALFPSSAVDAGIVLLYIIKTLDPYIRDKYTLLYVNTEVHHSNMPCMALWKEFFNLFPKYENTLDQLLVLHPGILFKTAFACCWPYISSSIWNGTIYLDHIQDLYKHIDEKTLLLPNYVKEYDQKNSSSSTQKLAHLLSRLSL